MDLKILRLVGSLALASTACFPAVAQTPPHRDVHLYVDQGELKTGVFDFDAGGVLIPDVRVFRGFLGEFVNGTNDPGFNASSSTFTPGTLVAFDIVDALRMWDGADFDAIPTERMTVSLSANNRQTPTSAGDFVTGFNITQVGGDGSIHQHVNYFLGAPARSGIYLLKLRVRVTAGATPSEPVYFVFKQASTTQEHDAAIAYVRDVLLAPPVCAGDANGDRTVSFPDITAVLTAFGTSGAIGIPGDANRDGAVSFPDITFILGNWGNTCP